MKVSIGVGAFFAVLAAVSSGLHASSYNNYALLADAFAHGHVWIHWPGSAIDALPYEGRYYVIEGSLPGLLLVPFAILAHGPPNQVWLGVVFAGIAMGSAWEICRRLEVSADAAVWLCLFFFAGTDLWWCANLGDVWFLAHLGSVAFTMLALVEYTGRRRGGVAGGLIGCACLCRFSIMPAIPVLAVAYLLDRERRAQLAYFLAALVPFAAYCIWYNEVRWHVPFDIGYTEWYHQDPIGRPDGIPFGLQYLPIELYSFFVRYPRFIDFFPWIVPSTAGIALEWTSPALALAFFARAPRPLVATMWALTIAVAVPSLLYYANGAEQFGMRHALDFEPFLFVLMALAVRRAMPVWGAVAITYSITVGMWGLWYWRLFLRGV